MFESRGFIYARGGTIAGWREDDESSPWDSHECILCLIPRWVGMHIGLTPGVRCMYGVYGIYQLEELSERKIIAFWFVHFIMGTGTTKVSASAVSSRIHWHAVTYSLSSVWQSFPSISSIV